MNSDVYPREAHRDKSVQRLSPKGEARLWPVVDNEKDYFIERDGVRFAGVHLLIDLWGASRLDDLGVVEKALKEAADVAGATLLHTHLHHFSPNGGISGVLVLAESHISIHTWPERGYAALDIFMCGDCDPHKAIPVLRAAFAPESVVVDEQRRGIVAC
ncbi:MAG: adenosylmethionine decarboxylase [Alphaproteobacteria bacterium]|nr:adenosylmethionine decarboxylase [Alphaproteobacteria bacterium]